MSFRLVPKSVTLNDLERRNGRYFALFQLPGRTAYKFTFAISSPDELSSFGRVVITTASSSNCHASKSLEAKKAR